MTRQVRTRCHPGATTWTRTGRCGDQIHDSTPVPGKGFEVLPHLIVIPGSVRQGPSDVRSDVVVTEAHGVRIAVGPLEDLGLGPLPYTGEGAESLAEQRCRSLLGALQGVRHSHRPQQGS